MKDETCVECKQSHEDMEWGKYISLHTMPPGHRDGWRDRPRDMPPE